MEQANSPTSSNWVFHAPGKSERIEAFFFGIAFAPHRHDTYAIGRTMSGVQSFDYRGTARHSEPGHTLVLHPDEKHDGRAGTDFGFQYRVVYIEPSLIQSVLGGKPLPFVEGGISLNPLLYVATGRFLDNIDHPLEALEYEDAIYDLANALDVVSGSGREKRTNFNFKAVSHAQQYLADHALDRITLDDLEKVAGYDRWKLSRDFRTLFGTSPYRYQLMRRLQKARLMMASGQSMSRVAVDCKFSDQSHMIRHFKKTYGITPKQWLKAFAAQDGAVMPLRGCIH